MESDSEVRPAPDAGSLSGRLLQVVCAGMPFVGLIGAVIALVAAWQSREGLFDFDPRSAGRPLYHIILVALGATFGLSFMLKAAAKGRRVPGALVVAAGLAPWLVGSLGNMAGIRKTISVVTEEGISPEKFLPAGFSDCAFSTFIGACISGYLLAAVGIGLGILVWACPGRQGGPWRRLAGLACAVPVAGALLLLDGPSLIGQPGFNLLMCGTAALVVAGLVGGGSTTQTQVAANLVVAAPLSAAMAVAGAASQVDSWAMSRLLRGIYICGAGCLDGDLAEPLAMIEHTGRLWAVTVILASCMALVLMTWRIAVSTLRSKDELWIIVMATMCVGALIVDRVAVAPHRELVENLLQYFGPDERASLTRPGAPLEATPYRVLPLPEPVASTAGSLRPVTSTYLDIRPNGIEVDGAGTTLEELVALLGDTQRRSERRPLLIHAEPEVSAGRVAEVLSAIDGRDIWIQGWHSVAYLIPAAVNPETLADELLAGWARSQLLVVRSPKGRNRLPDWVPVVWIDPIPGADSWSVALTFGGGPEAGASCSTIEDRRALIDCVAAYAERSGEKPRALAVDAAAGVSWGTICDVVAALSTTGARATMLMVESSPVADLRLADSWTGINGGVPLPAGLIESRSEAAVEQLVEEPPRFIPGGQITEPLRIAGPKPEYPEPARHAGVSGAMVLEVVISATGDVKGVKVLRGLPMGLTEAAVNAVKRWKYQPSTKDGKAIDVVYIQVVRIPEP